MPAPHTMVRHYTPDELAETLDGVSLATSARLWNLMDNHMTELKPLGGDGSNGTVEWPEPTQEQHSALVIWDRLTEDEQVEINAALEKEYAVTSFTSTERIVCSNEGVSLGAPAFYGLD